MDNMFSRMFRVSSPAKPPAAAPRSRGSRGNFRQRNYALGIVDRLSGDFSTASLTADQAIYSSISAMRNRARVLERDDAHVRKFLIMAKTSVVGAKGIRLQSRCGDYVAGKFVPSKYDQQLIEDQYDEFSKKWNFSLDGRLNRRRFAQIGLQRILVDGELIVELVRGSSVGNPYGMALNMIDAERLDHKLNRAPAYDARGNRLSNEIRMGVELDTAGRPVSYYFLKEAPLQMAGIATTGSHDIVPASRIRHIYIQERPGQTRGVTWLAPTGLRTRMLDGIETAVTVGYRVAASKMGIITKDETYVEPTDSDGAPLSDTQTVPADVAAGELLELPQGMGFSSFDPGYPNAEFDGFKKSIIREIAAGLGVSYPELGNDFGGVSYSAGQIGVHSDIAFWSDLQQFWIDDFEEPCFREWLPMAITTGALRLPIAKLEKFNYVRFQPPRRKHIDPLKTHNAQRVALGDMTRSIYDIAAENGADFEDIVEDMSRAVALLKTAGLPIPATWSAFVEPTPEPPEPPDPMDE